MKTSSGKSKQKSLKTLQTSLVSEAKKLKYNLETSTSAIKARNKKVVCKTFHKAGIVVPVINEVGYRPLTMTDGELEVVIFSLTCRNLTSSYFDDFYIALILHSGAYPHTYSPD